MRISNPRVAFMKECKPGWSDETFIVTRVSNTRKPTVYVIDNKQGEEIEGFFYDQELGHVEK